LRSPWIGSWTPSDTMMITYLYEGTLYFSVGTINAPAGAIVGQIRPDGSSITGVVTTTYRWAAELTSTQMVPFGGLPTPNSTQSQGGVMLVQLSGTTAAYFFCVHNVTRATSMVLYGADPDNLSTQTLLTICATEQDCASPFSSSVLSLTATIQGASVLTWLNRISSTDLRYASVYVHITSNEFGYPTAATRGQLGLIRTVTNPYPRGSSSSSSTGGSIYAGATSTVSFSPLLTIFTTVIATIVTIVAKFTA